MKKTDQLNADPSAMQLPGTKLEIVLANEMYTGSKKISYVRDINLTGNEFVIVDQIPGVYIKGVQYYDLKNIRSINYNGIANLIDLLRSLLVQGVEVRFVNVNEQ